MWRRLSLSAQINGYILFYIIFSVPFCSFSIFNIFNFQNCMHLPRTCVLHVWTQVWSRHVLLLTHSQSNIFLGYLYQIISRSSILTWFNNKQGWRIELIFHVIIVNLSVDVHCISYFGLMWVIWCEDIPRFHWPSCYSQLWWFTRMRLLRSSFSLLKHLLNICTFIQMLYFKTLINILFFLVFYFKIKLALCYYVYFGVKLLICFFNITF